jgi:hypothetical protein
MAKADPAVTQIMLELGCGRTKAWQISRKRALRLQAEAWKLHAERAKAEKLKTICICHCVASNDLHGQTYLVRKTVPKCQIHGSMAMEAKT